MSSCKSCKAEVSSGLLFCPNCGQRLLGDIKTPMDETGKLSRPIAQAIAYLEILGGPEDGRIIRLNGEKVSVGRREDNDIAIQSDSALSRRHAFIYWQDNRFWLEDRKSSFGTWVNGERVPVETAVLLSNGCLIRLAFTLLLFFLGEAQEVDLQTMAAEQQAEY